MCECFYEFAAGIISSFIISLSWCLFQFVKIIKKRESLCVCVRVSVSKSMFVCLFVWVFTFIYLFNSKLELINIWLLFSFEIIFFHLLPRLNFSFVFFFFFFIRFQMRQCTSFSSINCGYQQALGTHILNRIGMSVWVSVQQNVLFILLWFARCVHVKF